MQTREDVEKDFRADMQALLAKYDAKLEVKNDDDGIRMVVEIPPNLYVFSNTIEDEWLNIDLGYIVYLWDAPNVKLTGCANSEGVTKK